MERYQPVLVWISGVGALIAAGVFFAFSNFVMKGLAQIPPAEGMRAMNAINVTVINPVFMAILFGTGAIAIFLAAMNFSSLPDPGAVKIIAGAAIYIVGSLGVTMAFNVPLNDALAAAGAGDAAAVWADYLKTWLVWNHARGFASLAAGVLLLASLFP